MYHALVFCSALDVGEEITGGASVMRVDRMIINNNLIILKVFNIMTSSWVQFQSALNKILNTDKKYVFFQRIT